MIDDELIKHALTQTESLLSLLHHRGLVDSEYNRLDVEETLRLVREALKLVQ